MGIQYFNRGGHHSKYWIPIHYDTIEDGQNKTSHRLFSKHFSTMMCVFKHSTDSIILFIRTYFSRSVLAYILFTNWKSNLQNSNSTHQFDLNTHRLVESSCEDSHLTIFDMIKRNESDVKNIVFEILAKNCFQIILF